MKRQLRIPTPERIFALRHALQLGMSTSEVCELTGIDPWFINNLKQLVEFEAKLREELPSLVGAEE